MRALNFLRSTVRSTVLATGWALVPCAVRAQSATVVTAPIIKTPDIQIGSGESLFVHFSVRTDTIVRVVGGTKIAARSCGYSMFFIRIFRKANLDSALVLSDSVTLQVKLTTTAAPSDTTVLSGVQCSP